MTKTKTAPKYDTPYTLHKGGEIKDLISRAIALTTDPTIKAQGKSWFPRLMKAALTAYIEKMGG